MITVIGFTDEEFFNKMREIVREEVEKLNYEANEKPMTIKEAAAFLNCGVQTLYNQTSKGEIPFYKNGSKLRFIKEDLIAWVKKGKNLTAQDYEERAIETLTRKK